ncbi:hypothetical protein [Phytohabitans aurantiacus]|nr:hypothetical protein [Phytohabitans aurantiacus]
MSKRHPVDRDSVTDQSQPGADGDEQRARTAAPDTGAAAPFSGNEDRKDDRRDEPDER